MKKHDIKDYLCEIRKLHSEVCNPFNDEIRECGAFALWLSIFDRCFGLTEGMKELAKSFFCLSNDQTERLIILMTLDTCFAPMLMDAGVDVDTLYEDNDD